jgi:thymidylate synthase
MKISTGRIKTFDRSGGEDRSKPFNIASYALLTMMVARVTGCEPGEFVYTFGDVHLYLNHLDQADRQLAREPFPLPRVHLHGERRSLLDFRYEDVELLDYRHHPAIPAPVSV